MGYFSLWHWVILLVPLAIAGAAIWMTTRVLRKAGYSGWWVLVMVVPVVNLIMLWVFAFSDWPALRGAASPTKR